MQKKWTTDYFREKFFLRPPTDAAGHNSSDIFLHQTEAAWRRSVHGFAINRTRATLIGGRRCQIAKQKNSFCPESWHPQALGHQNEDRRRRILHRDDISPRRPPNSVVFVLQKVSVLVRVGRLKWAAWQWQRQIVQIRVHNNWPIRH